MHLGRSPEHLVLRCLKKKIHTQKSASDVFCIPILLIENPQKPSESWTGDVLAGGLRAPTIRAGLADAADGVDSWRCPRSAIGPFP